MSAFLGRFVSKYNKASRFGKIIPETWFIDAAWDVGKGGRENWW